MDIPLKYKQLWSNWDIRVLILLSLSIQIILIFLGRLRRTFPSKWMRMVVWGSYLLADWVADFVLGQLSSSMDDSSSSNVIIAFWAPFLVLHLGGPDTITAYSIEDNKLWGRHLIGLGYELIIAFYVLFRSLPNTCLLAPTLLIFLVAIIKYAERSYSLYRASNEGVSMSMFWSIMSFTKISQVKDWNIWTRAFWLYFAKKTSFIDGTQINYKKDEIEEYLQHVSTDELLQVMRMELNFAYNEFYTKAIINHSRSGYVLRVFCSICILLAFLLFLLVPKDDFEYIDVAISYVLLIGAICLDSAATIMLVFSDWMVVILLGAKQLTSWSVLLAKCIIRIKEACHVRAYWSIKVPQFNILAPNKTYRESRMNRVAKKLFLMQAKKYMTDEPLKIYAELVSSYLQTMEPVHVSKRILENITCYLHHMHLKQQYVTEERVLSISEQVTTKIIKNNPILFGQVEMLPLNVQVLVWHIVTEFYCHPKPIFSREESVSEGQQRKNLEMEFETCVCLSNYMMDIVVRRSDIISITKGELSSMLFWSAFAALFKLIQGLGDLSPDAKVEEVCKIIMNVSFTSEKNFFMIVRDLVRLILGMIEKERWTFLAKTWVELLAKGAKNSRADTHVNQLSRGDDLLTFVWIFNKNMELSGPNLLFSMTEELLGDSASFF